MMVIEDLKPMMPLRDISRICGISLSSYYYTPRERHIDRLDPLIKDSIREIASERSTYGYRRVLTKIRNQGIKGEQKECKKCD